MKKDFSLYREYSQKSKVFLYPILGIPKGNSVSPIGSYVTMEGRYDLKDCCLLLLFQMRNDDDYRLFVNKILKSHKYYKESFELTEENKNLFVFDLSPLKGDWDNFCNGKYSKLTVPVKNSILSFYKKSPKNLAYVESYLYPYKYMRIYADALTSSESEADEMYVTLKGVGELCSKPDFEKENLVLDISKLVKV